MYPFYFHQISVHLPKQIVMAHIELHDGSLSYNGWTKVNYRGKEFNAPVDALILMAWDYMIHLIETKSYEL